MGAIASQITSLTIVYSTVYSDADQRKHQSSASLAFVRGIHRGLVNSPCKGPVTRKMFPFDDVIMVTIPLDSRPYTHYPNENNMTYICVWSVLYWWHPITRIIYDHLPADNICTSYENKHTSEDKMLSLQKCRCYFNHQKMEMSSFWQNLRRWLYRKLSKDKFQCS